MSDICPLCGKEAAEHPWIFIDCGARKIWLSGPWASWLQRIWNRITRRPCSGFFGAREVAAKMVDEIQKARMATRNIPKRMFK